MSLPSYPSYVQTAAQWIGKMPSSWELKRIGYFFEERREKVSDTEYPALSVTKNGIVPQLETAAKTDDNDNRKRVAAGDFVINSRSDRKGSSGVSQLDGSVSLINTVLIPSPSICPSFAHHLFRSVAFQEEFYRFGKGIVADLWSTNFGEMKNISIPVPSLREQEKIATFLDHETDKIDALVEEQQRLIELLQEKRQAVISHAVTKGLDPTVPKKISGVEWIDSIPSHWDVLPIFRLGSERIDSNTGMIEDNLLSLSYGEIVQKNINSSDGLLPESFETYQIVQPGDIVLRLTDLQNDKRSLRSAIVTQRGIITSAYTAIAFDQVNPKFASYLLRAYDVTKVFYSMGGGLRQSLKFSDIKRLPILVPRASEQLEIVSYLDAQTARMNALMVEAKQAITLLQERRTALISAAVTGKIDVRNWQKQEEKLAA